MDFGVSKAGAARLAGSLVETGAGESRDSIPAFCRSNRSLTRISASITRARFSSLLIPSKATSSFCSGDRSAAQSCRLAERVVSDRLSGVVCWVLGFVRSEESSRALSSCGAAGCDGSGRRLGVIYSCSVDSGSGGSGLSAQFGGTFLDLAEKELDER